MTPTASGKKNQQQQISFRWLCRQPSKAMGLLIRQPRKSCRFILRHPRKFLLGKNTHQYKKTNNKINLLLKATRYFIKIKTIYQNKKDSRPVVLLLSTYPFQKAFHGGQIRLKNIATAYELAGFRVHSVAVYDDSTKNWDAIGLFDIYFDKKSSFRKYKGKDIPFVTDLQTGKFSTCNDVYYKIIKYLPDKLDVIHSEQPWMWPLVKRLSSLEKYQKSILVNGTANVENELKSTIFNNYGVSYGDIIKEIKDLEISACREADITLGVTKKDLNYFEEYITGYSILAPNGISPWSSSNKKLQEWRAKLPTGPWLLYIASAHPPNFTGFVQFVGDSLACLPPDGRIVVAGSVSEHIHRVMSETRFDSLNLHRLHLLYELSDEDLSAVKSLAPAFLLPLMDGGGSNLKTPEALYSNASVIGSSHAFRGFEEYENSPGVHICRTVNEFRKNVICFAQTKDFISWERPNKNLLTWDYCLSKYIHKIQELKLKK